MRRRTTSPARRRPSLPVGLRVMPILLVFGACSVVDSVSIDYLHPGEVSFPAELRRVGVVNNVPPQSLIPPELERPDGPRRPTDPVYFNGDARLATEALAQAIAGEDYFDEVIICDSALRQTDRQPRQSALSRGEVDKLVRLLDVDFLIALENLPMKCTEHVDFNEFEGDQVGSLDLTVYPVLRIYLPHRNGPMATIATSDSIYWEAMGRSREQVRRRLVDEGELLREGSDFAGTVPLQKLLPHWRTVERSIFVSGSANMRDAAVHVRQGQWPQAIALWEQVYRQRKGRRIRMQAAFNLALGYELNDSIDLALEWIGKSANLASEAHSKGKSTYEQGLILKYQKELEERKAGYFLLDKQMGRFDEQQTP